MLYKLLYRQPRAMHFNGRWHLNEAASQGAKKTQVRSCV
jgi:hypothetical protein